MLLRQKVSKSLVWSFFTELVNKLTLPFTFLVLAQMITPDEFGVIAVATVMISFSQIFWEAGIAKALIQTKLDIDNAASTAFWLSLILGLIVFFVLYCSADAVTSFFDDERISEVIKALSFQALTMSFVAVHLALLQRAFQFKHLFWIKFSTGVFPAIVSLFLPIVDMDIGR